MTPIRPKFENPPLIERAISISFEKLEEFSLGDYGLFWALIRDEFPQAEAASSLVQAMEDLDGFAVRKSEIRLLADNALPRGMFRNPGRGELVQVQPDRFGFNWLKASPEDCYPHSEAVLARFFELLDRFISFVAERGMGQIEPVQCELTNVNVIPVSDVGEAFADMSTVVRLADLDASFDCLKLETQLAGARHLMIDEGGRPIGRVHSLGQPSVQTESGEKAFRLDVTARGAPLQPGMAGVEKFFERAVSAVNGVFLASVTQTGRQFWGERDG